MTILRFKFLVSMLLCLGLYQPAAQAISIGVQPSIQTVNLNDTFNLDVIISGLSSANEVVSAFDLALTFDPTIINPSAVIFGIQLGDVSLFEALTDVTIYSGKVNFSEVSFLPDAELLGLPQADSFTLATLSFNAVGVGFTDLQFDPGLNLVGLNANSLVLDIDNNSQISVAGVSTPVPAPETVWLMVLGLMGLARTRFTDFLKAISITNARLLKTI